MVTTLRCLPYVDDQSNDPNGFSPSACCARLKRCENYKRPVMAAVILSLSPWPPYCEHRQHRIRKLLWTGRLIECWVVVAKWSDRENQIMIGCTVDIDLIWRCWSNHWVVVALSWVNLIWSRSSDQQLSSGWCVDLQLWADVELIERWVVVAIWFDQRQSNHEPCLIEWCWIELPLLNEHWFNLASLSWLQSWTLLIRFCMVEICLLSVKCSSLFVETRSLVVKWFLRSVRVVDLALGLRVCCWTFIWPIIHRWSYIHPASIIHPFIRHYLSPLIRHWSFSDSQALRLDLWGLIRHAVWLSYLLTDFLERHDVAEFRSWALWGSSAFNTL